MPRIDGGKPAKKKPYTLPKTRVPEAAKPKPKKRPPKAKPKAGPPTPSTAFRPLGDTRPLAPQQREAAAKTRRAKRRLPPRPLPRVPVIANPTPQQTQAARQRIAKAMTRAVGRGGSGGQRLARRAEIAQEFMADPAMARAIRHYGRAAERHMALAQADRFEVPGYRGDREQVGRLLLAMQRPARANPKPLEISAAGIPLPLGAIGEAAQDVGRSLSHGHGSGISEFLPRVGGAIAGDVKTLATAPFIAGVELGGATLDLLRYLPDTPGSNVPGPLALARGEGSSERAERVAAGTWEGLKESAPGQLVQGDLEGVGEAFERDPLISVLDFAGLGSIVGRTGGAVARGLGSTPEAGGVRGALARGGSTVRPPLALSDDVAGGIVERTYSKDLSRKFAQAVADSRREPLRDADGKIVTVTQRGREVPVLKATPRERSRHAKREADFAASRANMLERMERDQTGRQSRVRRAGPTGVRGRATRDVVAMAVEGTITSGRNFERDLTAHAERLRGRLAEHERTGEVYRDTAELKAAQGRLALAEKVLGSPKALAQAERVVAAAEGHARRLNAGEAEAIRLGMIDGEQARRRRLMPAAIEHMGARHVSAEEHARLEKAAQQTERAIRERLDAAKTPAERTAIRAELRQAREDRIAVSGRDPRGVRAHESARARAAAAKTREGKAAATVARLEKSRARLLGGQAVRRGQEAQAGPLRAYYVGERRFTTRKAAEAHAARNGGQVRALALSAAEAKRTGKLEQVNRLLKAKRAELRKARGELRQAEQALKATPLPRATGALRTAEGRFLSTDEIEAFLRAEGRDPETIAYLPHRTDVRGGRAHHAQFRPGSRPTLAREATTGESYRKGVTEASTELLRDAGVRQSTQLAKAKQLDRAVADHGMRHPAWAKAQRGETLSKAERRIVARGGYFTSREAAEFARRVEADTGERLVAVRAYGAKLDAETQRIIREDLQGPGAMESLALRLLNDRVVTPGDLSRSRNVVLMKAEFVERLNAHLQPAGEITKFLQALNRPFRFAVLAQPRWLVGNAVEPFVVRLTASGAGLNVFGLAVDIAAATRTLRRMRRSPDPKVRAAARELEAQQLGGLFIGGRGASVRRSADEFEVYSQVVRDLPFVGQAADMLRLAGRALMAPAGAYFRVNRAIEAAAQRTALGRDIRADLAAFRGSWLETLRLQGDALDEVAQGLVNTPTQRRFMRSQHELLGMYDGYPPWARRLIQTAFPFIPWALNAARWTMWTMPAHHSALTAVLVKTNDVVARDWEEIHSNLPPGALRLAIPTKKGGWIDLVRYTPWGLTGPIAEGEIQGVTDQAFPAFSGAFEATQGRDPFGRPLRVDPSENAGEGETNLGQRLGIAGYTGLEALVPYLSQIRRVREGGGTGFAGSTVIDPDVKPGSVSMSGLRRTYDPLRPTYLSGGPSSGGEIRGTPPDRRQQLLERRAELLSGNDAATARRQELLQRRADMLAAQEERISRALESLP